MPPKISSTCWRCRHDRQGCVREQAGPCNRCVLLRYTCSIDEPPVDQREGRKLKFDKCDFCRKAHQSCQPSDEPERCARCVERRLPCSPLTNTKSRPRPRKSRRDEGDGPAGSSNDPGQDDPYSEDGSSGYTEEDEAGYSEAYMYSTGGTSQYGVYSQQFDQYTNYSSYPPDVYQEFVYDQVHGYDQQQQQHYNYGNY
ncbi:hypothetical protein TWF694_006679 [Orbilia ellipsospora]|uniref:Zn(2)-C6 fungal-type domain-containing protein n=1 Tax=Orbilia ellipsospora TaxID=2528407 RepID=A0AAV9XKY8_9PEZI